MLKRLECYSNKRIKICIRSDSLGVGGGFTCGIPSGNGYNRLVIPSIDYRLNSSLSESGRSIAGVGVGLGVAATATSTAVIGPTSGLLSRTHSLTNVKQFKTLTSSPISHQIPNTIPTTSLISNNQRLKLPYQHPSLNRSVADYYTIEASHDPLKKSTARISLLKNPLYLGHYSSRVNRKYNEDRYFAGVLSLPVGSSLTSKSVRKTFTQPTRQVFNFAVFDGHGGSECSQYLKDHLAEYVENCDLASGEEIRDIYRKNVGGYWRAWGPELDKYINKLTTIDDLQLRIPLAFLKADYEFSEKFERAGSTATSVYLYSDESSISSEYVPALNPHHDYSKTPKAFWDQGQVTNLIVAHVGDTRCILCDSHGNVQILTTNHHPSSSVENSRLKRYATSFFTDSFGEERFGNYANTRAFGDFAAKAKGITAEPEILECRLGDKDKIAAGKYPRHIRTFTGDEGFLVLMSDGVTGMISDQEIVDLVINTANKAGSGRGTPQDAAKEIIHYAEAVGGDDNATCMVIRLSGWGKWGKWTDRTGPQREERLKDAYDSRSPRSYRS